MTRSCQIRWLASKSGKILLVALAVNLAVVAAQAHTLTVLHNFADAGDGSYPYAGVTIDRAGNLYGTTSGINQYGGNGTVFKMSHVGSGWTLSTIYTFY